MIYLLSTNRPNWFDFAALQAALFDDYKLIVLDNSKDGIYKWASLADEYYHIPEQENVSQMFNWFADNHWRDEDIFYVDDDVEISPAIKDYASYLKDHDMVVFPLTDVTDVETGGKAQLTRYDNMRIGSTWFARGSYWKEARFDPETPEGVYKFHLGTKNTRRIMENLTNYLIHDSNEVLRKEHFQW